MACRLCHTHVTLVTQLTSSEEGVSQYTQNGFDHVHDPNPIRAIWICPNGHETVQETFRVCIGCTLENQHRIKMEQLALLQHNREHTGSHAPSFNNFFSDQGPIC